MMRPHVHHITYCTPDWAGSARDLARSAARYRLRTRIYGPQHPAIKALASAHPHIMSQKRGAGFWLWKPAALLDTLRRVPDGDLVIYSDASIRFLLDPAPLLDLATDAAPSVLFDHIPHLSGPYTFRHSDWTKADCLVLMHATGPDYVDAVQVIAGFQIHRAGPRSRAIVAEWLDWARDPRILTDQPNTMGVPNDPGFREHRHDQSILTNLALRNRLQRHPDPSVDLPGRPRFIDIYRRPYPLPRPWFWHVGRELAARPNTRSRAMLSRLLGR